ncbi:MAG: hypothetical protein M0031_09955 [Thermaerobacter sp.]|nr:hypothetical protein [Thermaerobacter sp.]
MRLGQTVKDSLALRLSQFILCQVYQSGGCPLAFRAGGDPLIEHDRLPGSSEIQIGKARLYVPYGIEETHWHGMAMALGVMYVGTMVVWFGSDATLQWQVMVAAVIGACLAPAFGFGIIRLLSRFASDHVERSMYGYVFERELLPCPATMPSSRVKIAKQFKYQKDQPKEEKQLAQKEQTEETSSSVFLPPGLRRMLWPEGQCRTYPIPIAALQGKVACRACAVYASIGGKEYTKGVTGKGQANKRDCHGSSCNGKVGGRAGQKNSGLGERIWAIIFDARAHVTAKAKPPLGTKALEGAPKPLAPNLGLGYPDAASVGRQGMADFMDRHVQPHEKGKEYQHAYEFVNPVDLRSPPFADGGVARLLLRYVACRLTSSGTDLYARAGIWLLAAGLAFLPVAVVVWR